MVNLKNLKFLIKSIYLSFANLLKYTKIFTKPLTRAPRYILIKSFFLAIGWSKLHNVRHVFKNIETTMRWNCMSKALRFLQITAEYQEWPFFIIFLTIKTAFQNISIRISLKRHEYQSGYWRPAIIREKAPVKDFVRTVLRAEKYCWK